MRILLLVLALALLGNGCSGSPVGPDQGQDDVSGDTDGAPDHGANDAYVLDLDFAVPPHDATGDGTDAAMPGYVDTPCQAANGCEGAYECLIEDACALACSSDADCGDGCCRGPSGGNTYCYPPRHCPMMTP
jgi:hypothetical protein